MVRVLQYGDKLHIQNGYDSWKGGYLDTCGNDTTGNKYGVSTADSPTRAAGTGTWEITSASGKAVGDDVLSGDVVYLRNLYGGDGGYLDTCGNASTPNKYQVSTSPAKDRAAGTGRWRVFAESSSPGDGKVREGDHVHILNGYQDWTGGFLDTCGGSTTGDKYAVSTSDYSDRGLGTGTWTFAKVPVVLKYGDKVHLQNGYDNWKGGYLDTRGNDTTGNKYGVSTADSPTRAAGTGTWEITSASGKAVGDDVLSGDVVYLRNLYGGDGGYLDTCGHATAPNKYQVSTSPKKDRAAGTGRWRVFAESSSPGDGKVRGNWSGPLRRGALILGC